LGAATALSAPVLAQEAPVTTAPAPATALSPPADELAAIRAELERQARLIARQQAEIETLRAERDETLAEVRAMGLAATGVPVAPRLRLFQAAQGGGGGALQPEPPPPQPVGERPTESRPELAVVPPEIGVLTAPGHLVVDPSLEYVRSSNNRLVFRGVEIVPGIQLGVIEASDAARDTGVANLALRYGVTPRMEVEARAPYVVRRDRITTLVQREETATRSFNLDGRGIGDIELTARYQLNGGRNGWPVFVAASRLKPPTGEGPFDVRYDQDGAATELATGSGFWGLEGGLTALYATDPAVIFGSLTYLHNFSRDVDREIGGAFVGRVEPGASIGASVGFGLSLNPRFSISLGYAHSYIRRTRTELGETVQSSQPLQVGNLTMGWSLRLTERLTLNNGYEFGVTSDAADARVVLRLPYRF
jgi:hypothetical protein